MTDQYAERLEKCYSGAVFDVLHRLGHSGQVLPVAIQPLDPNHKLAGRIFTMTGRARAGLSDHETLLAWTAMLSKAPRDSVLVCQPNDSTMAHMGELSSETLQARGIGGYIVDGGCRDSEFIIGIKFPVWCRYCTPNDIVGRWIVEELGGTIQIGGVEIRTGDYVMADRDGVIVIPSEMVDEVVAKTEEVLRTESLVRKAIRQGIDPQEAYSKYGKF
jgi:regulator of RNase E activity RraA